MGRVVGVPGSALCLRRWTHGGRGELVLHHKRRPTEVPPCASPRYYVGSSVSAGCSSLVLASRATCWSSKSSRAAAGCGARSVTGAVLDTTASRRAAGGTWAWAGHGWSSSTL